MEMEKLTNSFESQEQSLDQIKILFDQERPKLLERLEKLTNAYHNKQHAEEVAQNIRTLLGNLANPDLLDDKKKLLLIESALRHDDGHSGNRFRQEAVGGELSNEEYAVKLLKQDLQGKLEEGSLEYMADNILATTFGQSDISKLPKGKENYFRSYKAETASQKLLVLADVGGFTRGCKEWLNAGLLLIKESPLDAPPNIDVWITNSEKFVNLYISQLLDKVKNLLKPEYFEQLRKDLDTLREGLTALKDESNPERLKYKNRLNAIKKNRERKFTLPNAEHEKRKWKRNGAQKMEKEAEMLKKYKQ